MATFAQACLLYLLAYISLDPFYTLLYVCQQYTWMTWKMNLVSISVEKQIPHYTALQVPVYTKYSNYAEVFYQKKQFVPRDHMVLKNSNIYI